VVYRVGIIGGGNISDTHARAAASIPAIHVVAVHGANTERTARLAAAHGAVPYDDYDRFLEHPLDFVVIGSPSGRHAEQGIAAARRGLHVLVEKPIDISTERADALIAAAAAAGVTLGVIFQDRLHPAVVEIKSMMEAGALGSPVIISGRVKWYRPPEYYAQSRWRGTKALDGGGALINQAIHTVDLIQWLFGPVARVFGTAATRVHQIEVEDTAAAVMNFASGAIGTIEAATSVFPGYERRLEVTGTEGTVVLTHDRLEHVDLRSGTRAVATAAGDRNASASSPVVADVSAHRRVLEDFIHAIEAGDPPMCDGREGRKSVELVEAIYASARSGMPVAIASPPTSRG
jgi:UDP-N-acetyl-2-amino-2-deoxyglucuronate dehydrogenase